MTIVELGTGVVGSTDIVALAERRAVTGAAPAGLGRLAAARAVLDRAAASGTRIYGLNTGLGAKVGLDVRDDTALLTAAEFQNRLVRERAIGSGEPLSGVIVRAAIAARCAMLAQGGSGISVHVFQALCAMLDAGVDPIVPRHGSLGEGDLGLLAHVALVLIGEGEARYLGERLAGAEALRRAGLAPVQLGAKDGLSLINASAVSVGHGALVVNELANLFAWQEYAAALGFVAIRANRQIFDARLQEARPVAGQIAAAARLRALLTGTEYTAAGLQDPLSFRCLAAVSGVLPVAIGRVEAEIDLELNAAADNPLVLRDGDAVLSTGNFATPAFALAFENLGLAVAQAAQTSAARFIHLSNGGRAGLPRALSSVGGTAAGLIPLQKTAMALLAALRRHAAPAMLDYWPVSEGVEDHATQSPLVVEKTQAMCGYWRQLIGLEMLAAAQAADLQEGLVLGGSLQALHREVRNVVGCLDQDRPRSFDLAALCERIATAPPPDF